MQVKYFVIRSLMLTLLVIWFGVGVKLDAQCQLIDNSHSSVFITEEWSSGSAKPSEEKRVLSIHNNSSCDILLTTTSSDGFRISPSPATQIADRIHTRIEFELPDGAKLAGLKYLYSQHGYMASSVGGDLFFEFRLRGGRSCLFEVPKSNLRPSAGAKIAVPFMYAWEDDHQAKDAFPSVEHLVQFWIGSK